MAAGFFMGAVLSQIVLAIAGREIYRASFFDEILADGRSLGRRLWVAARDVIQGDSRTT
jgi:hypothetical protein